MRWRKSSLLWILSEQEEGFKISCRIDSAFVLSLLSSYEGVRGRSTCVVALAFGVLICLGLSGGLSMWNVDRYSIKQMGS